MSGPGVVGAAAHTNRHVTSAARMGTAPSFPGGMQPRTDGYWWGITTGTWLAFFAVLGGTDALSMLMLTATLSAAAAAVGWGEARHGKPFAAGHWVLFASAVLASSGAYFLPTLAYVAGYFGHRHHANHSATRPHTPSQNLAIGRAPQPYPMHQNHSKATSFSTQ